MDAKRSSKLYCGARCRKAWHRSPDARDAKEALRAELRAEVRAGVVAEVRAEFETLVTELKQDNDRLKRLEARSLELEPDVGMAGAAQLAGAFIICGAHRKRIDACGDCRQCAA
jgi:hypothetical protein